MPELEISPKTRQYLAALAERMAGRGDARADAREELQSHLEEKLLDYLNARQALSEADALMLVERHFGDPGEIGRELRGAANGAPAVGPDLARRHRRIAMIMLVYPVGAALIWLALLVSHKIPNGGDAISGLLLIALLTAGAWAVDRRVRWANWAGLGLAGLITLANLGQGNGGAFLIFGGLAALFGWSVWSIERARRETAPRHPAGV